MCYKKLYIDLDGIYKNKSCESDTYILTNLYSNDHAYNICSNSQSWNEIYAQYEVFLERLDIDKISSENEDFKVYGVYFFTAFFYPLGQWFSKVEELLEAGAINELTEVVFSSYSDNKKVFVFEAEAESNGQFFYKKSYFLSFYLRRFFQSRGFKNIRVEKNTTLQAKLSYYARGGIVLVAKVMQILFYKFIIFRRRVNFDPSEISNKVIITSRGIIQTQFIRNLYKKYNDKFILLINESSSKPLRNLKYSRDLKNVYYSEGNISFEEIWSECLKVIRTYGKPLQNNTALFYGIEVNANDLLPECSIKHFHCRTYARMVANSIEGLRRRSKLEVDQVISMEMLPPFSYYLMKFTNLDVIQLQTTALLVTKYPDFVYGRKFYFSDYQTYSGYRELGLNYIGKLDYIKNIKYVGMQRASKVENVRSLTYFTQPIHFDDENNIILLLKQVCRLRSIKLRVKLHPRSPIPAIDLSNVDIVNPELDALTVIMDSDLVATRTSSIGIDCWFLNKPVLFFVNGIMKHDSISYIPSDYKGTIKSDFNSMQIAELLDEIVEDFYSHKLHDNFQLNESEIMRKIVGF